MTSREDVIKALKNCYDPEIPINIVDLGLIYDVAIKKGKVEITMTLTALGCPLANIIVEEMKQKLLLLKGVKDVDVEIVFDPPWSPEKMSDQARKISGF